MQTLARSAWGDGCGFTRGDRLLAAHLDDRRNPLGQRFNAARVVSAFGSDDSVILLTAPRFVSFRVLADAAPGFRG